ncbi:MAG: hypothetical protein RLY20_935 [Verrucomicrobiota bacterium]|jgi:tetratricopeptide (TPR) repeat protein
MKTILISALAIFFAVPGQCCLNKSGTKYGGGSGSYFGWHSLRASLQKNLRNDGDEMEASLRGATNFNDRSDYAIALMYLGRNAEAVDLLERLEREKPGEFFIAANLGTAFELSGNNEQALHWINEGIRRNPSDHQGTEWLHARILEAKIAQAKDARWFESHSVLELDPQKIGSEVTVGARSMTLKELATAIEYQLGERLQFVKPPDAPVASLLYDYAVLEAVSHSMESAKRVLKLAAQYGYPPTKIDMLQNEFDRRLWWAGFRTNMLIGAGVVLAVAVLVVLYRRGIFVLSSKDLKRSKTIG